MKYQAIFTLVLLMTTISHTHGLLYELAGAAIGAAGFVVAAPIAAPYLGFTAAGIVAKSAAASLMSTAMIHSLGMEGIAVMQSVGAIGPTTGTATSLAAAGGLTGTAGVAAARALKYVTSKDN